MHTSWTSCYNTSICYFHVFFSFVWALIKEQMTNNKTYLFFGIFLRECAFTQKRLRGHARTVWWDPYIFHSMVRVRGEGPHVAACQTGPPMKAPTWLCDHSSVVLKDSWWEKVFVTGQHYSTNMECEMEYVCIHCMSVPVHVSMHEYIQTVYACERRLMCMDTHQRERERPFMMC